MLEEISLVGERPKKGLSVNTKRIIIFAGVFILVAALFTTIFVVATRKPPPEHQVVPKHKNLIIMIGDGYGPASVTMGREFKGADLNMEKYLRGLVRTKSNESLVTDSAAGATTYSCGIRTYNSAIAVDNNFKPCGTIFEAASAKGMRLGAVVTSRVTHATPAAFTSHAVERDDEDFIAEQQITANLDVLLGGGRNHFDPAKRPDGLDLIAKAKAEGYTVLTTLSDFNQYTADGPVLGLFAGSHMDYEIDRVRVQNTSSHAQPSLADMTRMALNILSKKGEEEGFMLLVEGSRIDHAGHDNDPAAHVRDILAFDEAAKVCIEFAQASGNTLIVATADHETGGMTLGLQKDLKLPYEYVWYPDNLRSVTASAEFMVDEIVGEQRTVEDVVKEYAWPDVTASELAYIQQYLNSSGDLLKWSLGKITSDRAQVGYTTHGHTGVDVDLFIYTPYGPDSITVGAVENYNLGLYFEKEFELDLAAITKKISGFNPRPT